MTCYHNTLLILSLTARVGVLLQIQHKIWGENKIKTYSFPGCHSLGGKVKASHLKDFYQNLRSLLGERRIMKLTIQSSCISLTFNIMTLFIMSFMDKSHIKTSISWMGFVVSSFSRYDCWYFSSITDTQILYLDVAFVPLHALTKTSVFLIRSPGWCCAMCFISWFHRDVTHLSEFDRQHHLNYLCVCCRRKIQTIV